MLFIECHNPFNIYITRIDAFIFIPWDYHVFIVIQARQVANYTFSFLSIVEQLMVIIYIQGFVRFFI